MLGLTLTAFVLSAAGVRAQDTSHATCTDPSYRWAFNSLGQSPCEIGEALGNVCTIDGSFNIQFLPAGYYYSGVTASFATNCVCNTVYYSVLNVCALCQGGEVAVWDEWNVNCTTAYSTFPDSIPAGSAVPHYAYLPLTANGTFDVNAARLDDDPEATPTSSSSSRRPTSSATSPGSSPSASASSSPSEAAGGNNSNTGAIAGGVVGGVVGLAVLAGLAFFFWRRKQRKNAHQTTAHGPESSFVAPNITGSTYTPPSAGFHDKIYDPNDPSTFPTSPNTPLGYSQQPQTYPYSPNGGYAGSPYGNTPSSPEPLLPNRNSVLSTPSGGPQNTYRGAPEL